ncbi:MAG: serine/threonine protein kinase [Ktedonobacteraceae bacterium]
MSTPVRYFGKYELRERLGQGGMAEVWKAFDPQLKRFVAIKYLHANMQADPHILTRFTGEAQTIASLRHPNIIHIYEFAISDPDSNNPTPYMVMDYIEGKTLKDYIDSTSRIKNYPPASDVVQLFASISLAIDYAHQHQVIHRDIKPANILLDSHNVSRNPMGEPILGDFGLFKMLGTATGTFTSVLTGTPYYLSPEQAAGRSINDRTDIYPLGVILYEMFTGKLPFGGEGTEILAVVHQHIYNEPTPPERINSNISPALSQVILRCLAKDPDDRFPSASAMTAALAKALNMPVPKEVEQSIYAQEETINQPLSEKSVGDDLPTVLSHAGSGIPVSTSDTNPPVLEKTQVAVPPSSMPETPSSSRRRNNPLLVALIALLIIAIIGAGIGGFFLFKNGSSATTSSQFTSQAYFLSSGRGDLTKTNSPGISDELVINTQNMPAPASGKSYFAWLGKDAEGQFIALGYLPFNNSQIHFLYRDPHHTNLLAITRSLLITVENSGSQPTNPSAAGTVYRADLPSTPDPAQQNFSILDHERHLAAADPTLDQMGIHGGLGIWLRNNTAQIYGLAETSRDHWNGPKTDPNVIVYIHGQMVHILDVLDGINGVKQDLPAGYSPDQRDATIAQIALIDTPNQTPPDFLNHVIFHLNSIAQFPGASSDLRQHTGVILNSTGMLHTWLEAVKKDAITLLNDQQLNQANTLATFNDLADNAEYAYSGQVDPLTLQVQHNGVVQVYDEIQRLATFQLNKAG